MGVRQFYKADSSLKQYYLVNDFSGGINTVDVDERTTDSEFRELLNVELIRAGMIQNRKGWGNSTLLNALIKPVTLPNGPYAMIKVVKSEGSLLQKLEEYEERGLDLVAAKQLLGNYTLEILFIYEQAGIRLGLLTLANTGVTFETITQIESGSLSLDRSLTSIETVDYTDFVYFNLSDLNPSFNGLFEYNIYNKTFRTIKGNNAYVPNAYEISKVGFNILAQNPLSAIRETPGAFNIAGLYLTTIVFENGDLVQSKTPLLQIPPNGQVTLNVIYAGQDIKLENFSVEFYTQTFDDEGLPVENKITATQTGSALQPGLARFAYTIEVQNKPEIYVRIKLFSGITLAAAKTQVLDVHKFASTTAMMDYFLEPENRLIVSPSTSENESNKLFLHRKFTATPYLYNKINNLSVVFNGQTVSTISVSNDFGIVYDGGKLTQGKKWEETTETVYNQTVASNPSLALNTSLQALNANTSEMDCDDFDDLTLATLSDPDSEFYKAPNDSLGFVLKVRRTHTVEGGSTTPTFSVTDAASYNASTTPKTTIGTITPPTGFNSGSSPDAFNNLTATQFQAWLTTPPPNGGGQQPPTADTYYGVHGYYTTTTTTTYGWAPYTGSNAADSGFSFFASTTDSTCSVLANANPNSYYTPSSASVGKIMELKAYYQSGTTVTYDIVGAQSYAGSETWVTNDPNGCAFFPIGGGSTLTSWAQSNINSNNYTSGQIIRVIAAYFDGFDFEPCNIVYYLRINKTASYTNCTTRKFIGTSSGGGTNSVYIGIKYFKALFGGSSIVDCDPITYSGQPMAKYYRITQDALGFSTPITLYDVDPVDNKGYLYYMINGTRHKLYYYQPSTFTNVAPQGTYLEIKKVGNIAEKRPSPTYIYYAGDNVDTPTNYYRYKEGSTLGTLVGDFTYVQFTDTPQETSYIDIYGIGVTENPQEVNQISLSGFRDLEIGSRLVLYKENVIWFSDLYQFDYIPNYNYIILPLTPDDRITSINYFKGSYMVFTKESIYKMSGTFGGSDFRIQIVSDAIGCISSYSIRPFNNTLVFMTRDGLYRVKQNYYQGGLENVEKIDKQIDNITPYNREVYSVLYNEQYLLFYKYNNTGDFNTAPFNVLKMYYNMDAPRGYPYVKDKHAIQPPIIAKFDEFLYSIRNGEFYRYDLGYTDFLPSGTVTDEVRDASLYTTKIRTHKISFGYPTHEKKFKSIIIKDIATEPVPLIFRIFVNNFLAYTSEEFVTSVNEFGQIEYNLVTDPFLIGPDNLMGEFDLGKDQLGDLSARVHKIVFAGRGKDILIDIERRTAQQFSIQDIGYVYKMGKAREDR
jgi:hypothetical protein